MLNGSPLIIITCAVTFSLLTGIIDLSVGAVGYAAGCLAGILIKVMHVPVLISFACGILFAAAIGALNGVLIVKLKLNSMLTTLGMMLVIRAVGKIITKDASMTMGDTVTAMRQAKIGFLGGFPAMLIIVVAVVVVSQLVLKKTIFGKQLIAVGSNEKVARNVGINVDRVKMSALIICSGICGIGGVAWVITLGSVVTRGLNSYEFLAIASAVLGGTSLFGGKGTFFPGSFFGAIILLFIANGLTNMGVSPFVIPLVRGAIIFGAMYADL